MRITTTIITAAALLVAPATANATAGQYGEYPDPTGTICTNTLRDNNCADMSTMILFQEDYYNTSNNNIDGNGYWVPATGFYGFSAPNCWYKYRSVDQWRTAGSPSGARDCVYVGVETVSRRYRSWLFNDIPVEDRNRIQEQQEVIYSEKRVGGTVVSLQVDVGSPRVQSVSGFCSYYSNGRWLNDRSAAALDRTPDSIMAACGFTRRQSDPSPPSDTPPASTTELFSDQPVGQVASVPLPRQSASCGVVRGRGQTVAVRSVGTSCKGSRLIAARYARTLRQPKGWRCVASKQQGRVRCVRNNLSRAKRMAVYGIYVRQA